VEQISAAPGCTLTSVGMVQAGALAITTVDMSSLAFTLSGTSQTRPGGEITSDGTYDPIRCP
jgi:hypothetical protein